MARIFNVLFLCTGNSARSIIGEVLANRNSFGKLRGFSAGSQPKGEIHPLTVKFLTGMGYDLAGLSSKSWDVFAEPGAPQMDFIFTVCDSAANEVCPIWPGRPVSAHWGVPDPAAATGTEEDRLKVFRSVYLILRRRVELFASLPLESLDRLALKSKADAIGRETPDA